ncbi:SEC10/PgrA surface exclusion domain-containing protein, partial [Streptococcus suis]
NVDTVTIVMPDTPISDEVKQRTGFASNVVNFKTVYDHYTKNPTSQWSLTLTGQGVKVAQASSTNIRLADKNKIVNFNDITKEQAEELALYNLQVINAIRQQLDLPALELNTGSMKAAQDQMDKYVARNQDILTAGHLPGDYFGENASNISKASTTMYDIKLDIYDAIMTMAFADAPSNWGHMKNMMTGASDLGVAFATFAGRPHIINV